jgi:hypothetical protein
MPPLLSCVVELGIKMSTAKEGAIKDHLQELEFHEAALP